ncbi:MAG: cobalamin B12-binding domain-containing protein [Candidatus Dadabacteria bacterium]|jgi:methylmalonyl-CoA mutase, C-terminal domain|nr:cobalamin B12-binding domain-containing protein [Candidatus Dadabacteria bacterium]
MNERAVRILIGKVGLDGHDRGVKIISRALRDAGYEVIYTGLHNSPQVVAEAAVQEDVDAVGISILSGAHNYVFPELIRLFKEKGIDDVTLFGGGIVPKEDIERLREKGVKTIFEPGSSTDEIVRWVRDNVTVREL